MTRNSGSPRVRPTRRTLRGLAVLTVSAIGLCATALAQKPAAEPPPLRPLAPIPPAPPPKDAGSFPKEERAIEHTSASVALPATSIPTVEALPCPDVESGGSGTPTRPFAALDAYLPGTSLFKTDLPGPAKGHSSDEEWLAGIRSASERNEKTLRSLDEEIRQHPDRAEAYYKRGCLRYRMAGAARDAASDAVLADLSLAVALKPDHVGARHWRGFVAAYRQEWDAAIRDYSWVIEHDPDNAIALENRAEVWMRRGDYDRAIADLDRAETRMIGWAVDLWARRAWCYAAKGQHDRAIAEYTRAIDRDPVLGNWVYTERAKSYRAKDDLDKALADLDSALSINPTDAAVHLLRADILLEDGDYWSAGDEADRLIKLLPNHPGPYFLGAVAAWLAGHEEDLGCTEAAWAATLAQRICPCAVAPRLINAYAAAIIGHGRRQALEGMDKFLALEPRLSSPYAIRAVLNATEGRFLPTCRDLTLFVAQFRRRNYRFSVRIDDWRPLRGRWFLAESIPSPDGTNGPPPDVAGIGGRGMERALQQLLASAFDSGR